MTKIILPFITFFLIETLFPNEYILLIAVLIFTYVLLRENNWNETKLYLLGLTLGFTIELGMGYISRSQYWINTSILPIPIWLPFIWGYGFVLIHRIGKMLVK